MIGNDIQKFAGTEMEKGYDRSERENAIETDHRTVRICRGNMGCMFAALSGLTHIHYISATGISIWTI